MYAAKKHVGRARQEIKDKDGQKGRNTLFTYFREWNRKKIYSQLPMQQISNVIEEINPALTKKNYGIT